MLPNRNDWENPQLSAVNRLPSQASGLPFADEDSALIAGIIWFELVSAKASPDNAVFVKTALNRDAQRTPYHALPPPRPQYLLLPLN